MRNTILILLLVFFGSLLFGQNINNPNTYSFSLKVGYSMIQHLEPQIYAQNMNTQQMLVSGGVLSGLETMNGINFKAYYFFKNNLGVYLDLGLANSGNSVNYQNEGEPFIHYETTANYNSQSIGAASRFSLKNIPVNIMLGTSIGRFGYSVSYSQTADEIGQWYEGTYEILKFGIETIVEYNIFKGINLFSEINYSSQLSVDSENIYLEYANDSGDLYNIVYNSPSMAAIRTSFGINYNF
ncbi:MAG: hypothetical protein K9H06_21455 [Melioribacteraceae bacterium]|nr:hypothetical protein [Melioribacteraceae bacterium]